MTKLARSSTHAMTTSRMALLAGLAGCGGGGADMSPAPKTPEPPREPVTAEVLRARWEKLAVDETEVVRAIDAMATLPAEAKMQKLGQARQGTGFVVAGLTNAPPPAELKVCHEKALEGANELKAALDAISDLWAGKSTAPDRKSEATRLAEAVCLGAGKLAAGRSACGVQATVPSPLLCGK